MGSKQFLHCMSTGLAAIAVALVLANGARAASTTKQVYSFQGGNDGEYIDSDLVLDKAGNIYGSSVQGGKNGGGTVFQVTPSGKHTVLYDFAGGNDGGEPYKGVTLDAKGNLYGTTVTGGTGGGCEGGCGVVYKLTSGTWSQSVIYNFTGGNDGSGPGSGVTFDKHGNLYGMAPTGGSKGMGTIYRMKPQADGTWKFAVIHTFTGGRDGAGGSAGRMIFDKAGNLYGACTTGGLHQNGVIFKLTPGQAGKWTFQTLYAFKGMPDGGFPYGGLIFDAAGNLFGTTYYGGANSIGATYKLTSSNGKWSERVLYSFKGGTDGSSSISNMVFDAKGNLYGTTSAGGAGCDCGVVFKLAAVSGGKWKESVAYRFQGAPDGGFAYNGMVVDSAGHFYGATVHGGTTNDGTIYRFKP